MASHRPEIGDEILELLQIREKVLPTGLQRLQRWRLLLQLLQLGAQGGVVGQGLAVLIGDRLVALLADCQCGI